MEHSSKAQESKGKSKDLTLALVAVASQPSLWVAHSCASHHMASFKDGFSSIGERRDS
jgi:hypothetical protein